MNTITTRFGDLRAKVAAGNTAIGFGINQLRGAAPAVLADRLGYDWLFIDMEHGVISIEDASQICIAATLQGITPLVRVSKTAMDEGVRLLDNGAAGLVIPHVDTVEEAQAAIAAVRYPPTGHRSFSGLLPQLEFQRGDWRQLSPVLNSAFFLFLMIESAEACRNAEAIASLEGYDGLFIGASDLAGDMGLPGEADHGDVVAACRAVTATCVEHGRIMAIGGTRTPDTIAQLHGAGARLFLGGSDFGFVEAGAKAALAQMQNACDPKA